VGRRRTVRTWPRVSALTERFNRTNHEQSQTLSTGGYPRFSQTGVSVFLGTQIPELLIAHLGTVIRYMGVRRVNASNCNNDPSYWAARKAALMGRGPNERLEGRTVMSSSVA
jgi:hypothetical protein